MTKGVKEKCGGQWTLARYWSFISSGLRLMWMKYPVKHEALKAARRPFTGKDKRTKWEYSCGKCKKWFKGKDIQVDHINPVGSLRGYEDLPRAVENLFCELDNLQVLCKGCHSTKTLRENKGD